MFGVVRPCRHRLSSGKRQRWAGHLCGLCLTLRDGVGHDARLATSYDGLLLSVLVEDLGAGLEHRRAAPCPLRGLRPATVVASSAAAVQLAASVSLLLAAAKVVDHVSDGQ